MGYERPFVLHFSTMSVDGRIASSSGYSILSCRFDKARLYVLRGFVDAVMVGAGTVEVDDPRLVKRWPPGGRHYRIVVDCRARLDPRRYRIFDVSEAPTVLVACRGVADEEHVRLARGMGVEVVLVEARGGRGDLTEALRVLRESYGVGRILVEGGGVLAHSLYAQGLVDELRATIAPVVFAAGRSIVEDPGGIGFTSWSNAPRLRLVHLSLCPCGNCVHVAYEVLTRRCCPVASPPPREVTRLVYEAASALAP